MRDMIPRIRMQEYKVEKPSHVLLDELAITKKGLSTEGYSNLLYQARDLGFPLFITGESNPLEERNLHDLLWTVNFSKRYGLNLLLHTEGYEVIDSTLDEIDCANVSILVDFSKSEAELRDICAGKKAERGKQRFFENLLKRGFARYENGLTSRLGVVVPLGSSNFITIPEIFRYCRRNQIVPELKPLANDKLDETNQYWLLRTLQKQDQNYGIKADPEDYLAHLNSQGIYVRKNGDMSIFYSYERLEGKKLGRFPNISLKEAVHKNS